MMQQSTYDSERINMANRNDNYMDSYYRDDEYEEDEYEDEDEFDEDDIEEEIDNSEMSFFGHNICILLNDNEDDRRNR